jgi:ubiquinone/menaquinone biosynthesis C-methylase UbiE
VKVLDIGAGTQKFVNYFLSKYKKRPNIDELVMVPVDAMNISESNIPKDEINEYTITGDAVNLPFANDEFEILISNMTISSIPEIMLNEALRVLKPGGVILFNFHRMGDMKEEFRYEKGLARGSDQEIKQRFMEAGFVKVELFENGDEYERWLEVRAEKSKDEV